MVVVVMVVGTVHHCLCFVGTVGGFLVFRETYTYHIHEGMQYIYIYIQKATLTISLTKGHHVRSPTKDTKEG